MRDHFVSFKFSFYYADIFWSYAYNQHFPSLLILIKLSEIKLNLGPWLDECSSNLQSLLGDVNLSRADQHTKYKYIYVCVLLDIMTNLKSEPWYWVKGDFWIKASASHTVCDGISFPFKLLMEPQ